MFYFGMVILILILILDMYLSHFFKKSVEEYFEAVQTADKARDELVRNLQEAYENLYSTHKILSEQYERLYDIVMEGQKNDR